MKAVDVRSELVRALRLDAIGPDPGEPEEKEALPQSPSEWYPGFLVPYQAKAQDRQDPTSNEDVDEGGTAAGGDDPQDQEKPSARRAFLPSSLGLSVLVPKNAGSIRATVTWGDYRLVKPEEAGQAPEGESAPKPRAYWQRTPRSRRIEKHLTSALESVRLCSRDPVCAQHRPDNHQEERFLNGAACHGCLLIAEPSCERRNEYLDRALLVPTVDAAGAEFFRE